MSEAPNPFYNPKSRWSEHVVPLCCVDKVGRCEGILARPAHLHVLLREAGEQGLGLVESMVTIDHFLGYDQPGRPIITSEIQLFRHNHNGGRSENP